MQHKDNDLVLFLEEQINSFFEDNRRAPSIRELSALTGLSKSAVQKYLVHMASLGIIRYDGKITGTRARSLTEAKSIRVPLVGDISCGIPKLADECIVDYIQLPVSLYGSGEYFFLKASGDSMTEAGIDDGDLVLIRQQNFAQPGQIVVALMEEEATLKRYYPDPEHRRIRLHPENWQLEDIYVDTCLIQGVAISVMKNLL